MSDSGAKGMNGARPAQVGRKPIRLLLWAAMFGLLVGAINLGQPIEEWLRHGRNMLHVQPASGDIVIVAIDDRSMRELGKWPWPRSHHATLTDNLGKLGAKKIFFNIDFSMRSAPEDDAAFAAALARQRPKVTLPVQFSVEPMSQNRTDMLPLPAFRKEVLLANMNFRYNFRRIVNRLHYALLVSDDIYPTLAVKLANYPEVSGRPFPIDYSIDPSTIETVSAIDVINGDASAKDVAGKIVIIGGTTPWFEEMYLIPGHGYMGGVYVHVLGAETLLAGTPIVMSWLIPFCLTFALIAWLLFRQPRRRTRAGLVLTWVTLLIVPAVFEHYLIFADVLPSLVLVMIVSSALVLSALRDFFRARGNVNAVSGLPSLNALRHDAPGHEHPLIVVKVQNYSEIASALSADGEKALARQIANRLAVVSPASKLYQSDEGIFAWFADQATSDAISDHLTALHGIFRSPVVMDGNQIDLTVTFGVDNGTDRTLAGRLNGALVAADEALREGLKWKQYDPAQQEGAAWKLSLLSQLDQAIDAGDLWVAFQPKMDLATRQITGAEALVRWRHAQKGIINPDDFILAAEQGGRIGKLTRHVLSHSIEAAQKLNSRGIPFNVAVNLSARLIDDVALVETISELLARHRVPPGRLTLEITETAALAGTGKNIQVLAELRAMGVELSIDDYGTGLSTLDYLKRIPATEIKIDQSFVQAIDRSHSDRLMVHSTIQLAHSLGQKVVAEGVERRETLDMLAQMGCDMAQGFFIGRPMVLYELERRLEAQSKAA